MKPRQHCALWLGLLVAAGAGSTPPTARGVRPFSGADLVWLMRGPAVLAPESGPAIEAALNHPPELTPQCRVGDLKLDATSVTIEVHCGAETWPLLARLLPETSRLVAGFQQPVAESLLPLRDEVQRRLDAHMAAIPLGHTGAHVADSATPALRLWQLSAVALLAGNLPAAATATEAAIALGPTGLTPTHRLDAAILAATLGRSAAVRPWLSVPAGTDAENGEAMAVRALLGKRREVLRLAERCVAPEDRPACDPRPLIRALVAQGAFAEAAHLLKVRIEHREPAVDDVRLAIGVADLAADVTATETWAALLTRLRADDPVGWMAAAEAKIRRGDLNGALAWLLRAPDAVADPAAETVADLADRLLDPLVAAQGRPQPAERSSRLGKLLSAIVAGWRGDPRGALRELEVYPAAAPAAVCALRALALTDLHDLAGARAALGLAVAHVPPTARTAEAALELAWASGQPADDALQAYVAAQQRLGGPLSEHHIARAECAAQLRQWGLTPPPRWPAWAPPAP